MVSAGDSFVEYFTVSPDVHSGFIALFHDRHPLHTDTAYAVSLGFEGIVMHGNILNGFLSYFVGRCLPEPDVMILRQEIKFSRPVFLNDRLKLDVRVVDVHESVGLIELGCKFSNTDGKQVASAKIDVAKIADRRSSAP